MKKYVSLFASVAFAFIIIVIGNVVIVAQQINEQPDMTIDAKTRQEVIDSILSNLNDSYVFADVAKKMEENVRNRVKNKEYDLITSAKAFAVKLTEDLQSVSKDKHLRVRYSYQAIPVREKRDKPTEQEEADYRNYLKRINYGFEKVERMQGNIGYIDLRGFTDPELGAETVAAAMTFVNGTDSLIIDLRNNGGGDPAMVALICSYLFGDKPVHLNDLFFREGNRTEEFWTKPNVLGKKYGDRDVYVLTSNRTFSGGEEFANNLKVLKRATIVGETTGGGANPGGVFRINEHFGVFIPVGRAINPITKTNWEGTGVTPDVAVPKDQALKTAYLLALNKSFNTTKDENMKKVLKVLIDQNQKELDEMKAKK